MDIITTHLRTVVDRVWNWWGKCDDLADISTTHDMEIFNAALGLAGEAGEVCDVLKKMYFHGEKPGRREALKKEIGDVYFYLGKIQDLFGFTTEEILDANRDKLFDRFEIQ